MPALLDHRGSRFTRSFLTDFVEEYSSLGKYVAKELERSGPPRAGLMERCYFSWVKRERKAGKIKDRYLSKVTSEELKALQYRVLEGFSLASHDAVFSYQEDMSPSTMAARHVGHFAIYMVDIKDFFFSLTQEMVEYEYYQAFLACKETTDAFDGISSKRLREVARAISILTTSKDPRGIVADPVVIQGTSTAGMLSNGLLYSLDERLHALSVEHGLTYSRYSDNMYFSHPTEHLTREVQKAIIEAIESFTLAGKQVLVINRDKTKYMPFWRHQRVLGVVVNRKTNVPRRRERWLRSALSHLYRDALADIRKITANEPYDSQAVERLKHRARKVFGNHSYFGAVNRHKYERYLPWVRVVRFAISTLAYLSESPRSGSFIDTNVNHGSFPALLCDSQYADIVNAFERPAYLMRLDRAFTRDGDRYSGIALPLAVAQGYEVVREKDVRSSAFGRVMVRKNIQETMVTHFSPAMVSDPLSFYKNMAVMIDARAIMSPDLLLEHLWKHKMNTHIVPAFLK